MKLRMILADNDPVFRGRLRLLLEACSDVEVLMECATGSEAAAAARGLEADVLWLDVRLPGLDGFSVLDSLEPARRTRVVFVTADSSCAVRAFEAGALDYLLKPVIPARVALALERVRESRRRRGAGGPGASPAVPAEMVRFAVRTGSQTRFVAAGEIDWIEAAGNYAVLHCAGRSHMVRETMAALEGRLPGNVFLRANRSAILNLRRVKELRASAGGPRRAFMADGTAVPLTRGLREVTERMKALRC